MGTIFFPSCPTTENSIPRPVVGLLGNQIVWAQAHTRLPDTVPEIYSFLEHMRTRRTAAIVSGIICIGGLLLVADRSGPLREGDAAPGFTAGLSSGGTITLGDFRGKKNVVLFFYPKDFTSGCTKEACAYRDNYGEITKLDAVVFGISYDGSSSHASFISRYQLPYPLISDVDQTISRAYGTARFGGRIGPQRRVTYVIDKQGIIRRVSHHEIFIDRHVEDVIQTLKNLSVNSMKEDAR